VIWATVSAVSVSARLFRYTVMSFVRCSFGQSDDDAGDDDVCRRVKWRRTHASRWCRRARRRLGPKAAASRGPSRRPALPKPLRLRLTWHRQLTTRSRHHHARTRTHGATNTQTDVSRSVVVVVVVVSVVVVVVVVVVGRHHRARTRTHGATNTQTDVSRSVVVVVVSVVVVVVVSVVEVVVVVVVVLVLYSVSYRFTVATANVRCVKSASFAITTAMGTQASTKVPPNCATS